MEIMSLVFLCMVVGIATSMFVDKLFGTNK